MAIRGLEDMEHFPTANMEGDLSAAADPSTLEAILDMSLTKPTSSPDLKYSSQPELVLPGQPVVVSQPSARPQAPQGPRSPLLLERFLKEQPSSLEDAEDADPPHRSRS